MTRTREQRQEAIDDWHEDQRNDEKWVEHQEPDHVCDKTCPYFEE